ncbi:MAG TPA: hypothetical protein VHE55_15325 [Fimbriimonadaceae bacterium]|nr:hypothetical protein [Fimbriimonadaceae bacterium]
MKLWRGEGSRMLLFKWALCGALLTAMAVCPTLWETDRAFPSLPAIEGTPVLPQGLAVALASLLALSVLAIAVLPAPRRLNFMPPILAAVLIAFDMNRLQPWLYEYMLMFVGLGLMDWRNPSSKRSRAAWAVCGFVVLSFYLWSGIQKANMTFATEIFPWLIGPFGQGTVHALKAFWFLAPLAETSMGVLLVFPKTRTWGLGLVASMHLFNLFALGPLGLNYNSVVWPWNFWMIAIGFALFFRKDQPIFRAVWSTWSGKAILALMGVMPALNFAGLWDGFLSASYYSGRLRDGWIYLKPDGVAHMPEKYLFGNKGFEEKTESISRIDITAWAESTINVPPYAEPRIYRALMRRLVAQGVPPDDMMLLVRDAAPVTRDDQSYSAMPFR